MIRVAWPFPKQLPLLFAAACMALAGGPSHARDTRTHAVPAHGVIGVEALQLEPGFWIERLAAPDAVVMDTAAIAAQNATLQRIDPSIHDLRAMPPRLARADVAGWIQHLSRRPQTPVYDTTGSEVADSTLDALVDALAIASIPDTQATRHGLVVRRADLRTFPTTLRVFSRPGETDIDRFQESALFPGTPVVIAHESRDRRWWFVVSPRYAAWIEKSHVAAGTAAAVFGYGDRTPYRVVTGATARTVFTGEQPAVSELALDMGVRVPLAPWPADKAVNGQHPYTAHVIDLPVRAADGTLQLQPALLPRRADSHDGYLPLTHANIVRQAFKFLGERYGWGHAYNGRDCSGFVSEVYRSMGVELPRNTGDQARSPALHHVTFGATARTDQRMAAVDALQVGDLVYIPGHVMLMIGRVDGRPYVIHDTNGATYRGTDGTLRRMALNGVSVTPLLPLMFNERERYVERITSIVRIRP